MTEAPLRIACALGPLPAGLAIVYGAWAAVLLIVSISNAIGPEVWWPGSANLYVPQAIWGAPALAVVPWTLLKARRWIVVCALMLLWVFEPLMGWVCNPVTPSLRPGGVEIRVMQCNVKWARRDPRGLAEEVARQQPDIIQFQDSGGTIDKLGPIAGVLADWNIVGHLQYITATRYPVADYRYIGISKAGGESQGCTRLVVLIGHTQVALYNVHLLTPRWGLDSVRARDISGLSSNVAERLYEARRLADLIRGDSLPVLLTGDLNAPIQSFVCRSIAADGLSDAFQNAGNGYGYSYGRFAIEPILDKFGLANMAAPYVRIDHIFYSKQWTAVKCWTGSDSLSDHVPVYADLYLSPSKE